MTTAIVGVTPEGKKLVRHWVTGAANAIAALSVGGHKGRRVLMVTTAYSAAPTQAGVTSTLNSGAGAGYDTLLNTGTANARYSAWFPNANLVLGDDDALDVSAPAGGAGITASIAVYTEEL